MEKDHTGSGTESRCVVEKKYQCLGDEKREREGGGERRQIERGHPKR